MSHQSGKRIGVTGGTGFLGRRFLQMAAARGHKLVCLRRSGNKTIADIENVEFMQGDITEPDSLKDFVRDVDLVVHLAAYVGYGSYADYHAVNVRGTQNVCEAILKYRPDCSLIYCSSVAVLRRYRIMPWFNTLYTKSKTLAEKKVRQYQAEQGLKVGYVYPGLIYGPLDDRFVPTLLKYIKRRALINISGGERWAPLVYVDDLCDLILHMVSHPQVTGRRYIGVGKQEVGIHEFFRMLARRINAAEPALKLPKHLLMPLALFFEWAYRLLGKKEMPLLSRRVVDLLSINVDPDMVRSFNQQEWSGETSLDAGLNNTFQWLKDSGRL